MSAVRPPIEEADAFHNAFRTYFMAVETLAADPDVQCEQLGDFNVAWELKADIQSGRYLLKRGHLSAEEEQLVESLAAALEEVNTLALPAGAGRESNRRAMSHPSWEPSRSLARIAQPVLARAAQRSAAFLGLLGAA